MPQSLLLAIDVGASGTKAAVYDALGKNRGRGHVLHGRNRLATGRVEQHPETWWQAAVLSARAALAAVAAGGRIEAVAVSSTNALVLVDRDGNPVGPAIMQLDERAMGEADRLRVTFGQRIAEVTGAGVAETGYWLPVLRWLRAHDRRTLASATSLIYPAGFLVRRMTGASTMDRTRAATTMLFDIRTESWSDELLHEAGVRADQLPAVAAATDVVGWVQPEAARELGIPRGVPVVAGAMDSVTGALGLGVLEEGDASIMLGTVARAGVLAGAHEPNPATMACPYPVGGLWWSMAALWETGRWLQWSTDTFHGGDWSAMNLAAPAADAPLAVPPGPGRAGAILRLATHHRPAEVGDAAIMSGLAELADAVAVAGRGRAVARVAVGGRMAKLAGPALASLLGRPVEVPSDPETETAGGAMLAAVGAGLASDLVSACRAMAPARSAIAPLGDWQGYRNTARELRLAHLAVAIPGSSATFGAASARLRGGSRRAPRGDGAGLAVRGQNIVPVPDVDR